VDEMTTIAAMASSENLWLVPPKPQQEAADVAHMAFRSRYGDHVTLLFVYDEWARNDHSPSWCEANFFNGRTLATARLIRRQLRETLRFPSKRAIRVCKIFSSLNFIDKIGAGEKSRIGMQADYC
jgi:HrpA-like RNA helicase